jgi:alkanesulfonate monooxygenase SsuD/methylene tetrahydromethanopterin reductase-like flavin-dependent oxidoreductase (luciferase family)
MMKRKDFTSLIRMFFGGLTGNPKPLQPPAALTKDLIEVSNHPSLHQMLKYSFYGSKATVKKQVEDFIDKTQVDELMMVSNIFALEDRVKSAQVFAEIIDEINEEKSTGI